MPNRLTLAALAVVAILCLVWPALANGYPLLFPDSLGYLAAGHPILHTLLHGGGPSTCMRSALYALAILPFHFNRTPWPILLFHAALVVYTVYLTTRSITPRHALTKTLAILVLLGTFTSLSWYISLLMPDILGAPLYLALFLLTFARTTLSLTEQGIVAAIAVLGATAHTTHLLLAIFFCFTLGLASLRTRHIARRDLAVSSAVILASALLILAVNTRLYGHPTLDGNRPPYLEARLLADGPAAQYLRSHCPDPTLPELCAHLDNLPPNDDQFLWDDGGIWPTATPAQQAELLHEERPLALHTLRAYPRAQLASSLSNAAAQFTSFGLDSFDDNSYMHAHLADVLPHNSYDRSLQARNSTPWHIATIFLYASTLGALLACAALFRRATPRTRALILLVLAILAANAILTGVFSEVDSRYQARILWLLPLAALLVLLERHDATITVAKP